MYWKMFQISFFQSIVLDDINEMTLNNILIVILNYLGGKGSFHRFFKGMTYKLHIVARKKNSVCLKSFTSNTLPLVKNPMSKKMEELHIRKRMRVSIDSDV